MAMKMFKAYLTLKPDAQDKEAVKAKIKVLEEKLAAPANEGESTEAVAAAGTEEGTEKPAEPAPAQEELTPPPQPKPAPVVSRPAEPETEAPSHLVEWIVGGASVAVLITGVALNVAARSKMSACNTDAGNRNYLTANSECDSARPLAYTSYAMFGIAAAGAAVDALLIILHSSGSSSSSRGDSPVGLLMLPGGGGLTAQGRF
jgi:hypothetical protein